MNRCKNTLLLLLSCSVVSRCLQPHGLQHSQPPWLHCLPEFTQTQSIESMRPSNHLILCCPLLLLPSIFPSIRVFSIESPFCIRERKYWSFSFSISPSSEYSGLISFRIDWYLYASVQFSSVTQSCLTICDPMNGSMPGLPVHHQLPEFTQTHAHWVGDAIQPSHPLSSPSPPAPDPSQHQGLFQWVNSSHEVAKVLEFQFQHQSSQWTPRTDLL